MIRVLLGGFFIRDMVVYLLLRVTGGFQSMTVAAFVSFLSFLWLLVLAANLLAANRLMKITLLFTLTALFRYWDTAEKGLLPLCRDSWCS